MFFKQAIEKKKPVEFTAHYKVRYKIPNTIENLGVELLINGVYEKDIVEFLQKQVPRDAVFFDIGANIGSIGLPVIKDKPGIRYYGFEASPLVFEYLQYNFTANGIPHFELFNKLVHKNDQETMKFYEAELYGKSSLAPTYTDQHILVTSLSLDAFCNGKNIQKIDWMKVDVQGFELYVFEGMKHLLEEKKISNILFEFEAWADDQAGISRGAAQRFLEQMGYVLYGLDGKLLQHSANKNDTMIWARPQ